MKLLRAHSDLLLSLARRNFSSYEQGRLFDGRVREYFYYIDHQGQLFLDDVKLRNFTTCFKDTSFLQIFFRRLKRNSTGRYEDFPYVSPCGTELNFLRCDDVPVVFTHLCHEDGASWLCFNNAGNKLKHSFQIEHICMLPASGRIYHPASAIVGGLGLVKSSLAMEWSRMFIYENGASEERDPPTHFLWEGQKVPLSNSLYSLLAQRTTSAQ